MYILVWQQHIIKITEQHNTHNCHMLLRHLKITFSKTGFLKDTTMTGQSFQTRDQVPLTWDILSICKLVYISKHNMTISMCYHKIKINLHFITTYHSKSITKQPAYNSIYSLVFTHWFIIDGQTD